jgi:hypothetical protein
MLRMVLSLVVSEGDTKMFPLTLNSLKLAAAGALVTLAAFATPASADEMVQRLGSVGPHEPLLTTVGTKRIIAFFVPGNGQCNVQAVLWNADDIEAKSAAGVRFALNPSQTASIDSSPTETFTLKCGDRAESLASVDTDQQVASK